MIFKEKVYPPNKIKDTYTMSGVRFNLGLLKSLTWFDHSLKIGNEDLLLCELPPMQPRVRTVVPPKSISTINRKFLQDCL